VDLSWYLLSLHVIIIIIITGMLVLFLLSFTQWSVSHVTFSGAEMWEYSPKNCQNFGHNFAHQRRLICTIFMKFSAFVRVYR